MLRIICKYLKIMLKNTILIIALALLRLDNVYEILKYNSYCPYDMKYIDRNYLYIFLCC